MSEINIIAADSRGGGLEILLPEGIKQKTIVSVTSGKGYQVICDEALALLPPPHLSLKSIYHVYFCCGINDVTDLLVSKEVKYKECVMLFSAETIFEKVSILINDCRQAIIKRGAVPIFATIPKMNLADYNNHLLYKAKFYKRTKFVVHSEFYPDMQTRLNQAIDKINNYICETNRKLEVSIPFLHTTIMKRCGSKKTKVYYKYLWDLLHDGLHAGDELNGKWAETLCIAIGKNRSRGDVAECLSPKRSWLQEKRQRLN